MMQPTTLAMFVEGDGAPNVYTHTDVCQAHTDLRTHARTHNPQNTIPYTSMHMHTHTHTLARWIILNGVYLFISILNFYTCIAKERVQWLSSPSRDQEVATVTVKEMPLNCILFHFRKSSIVIALLTVTSQSKPCWKVKLLSAVSLFLFISHKLFGNFMIYVFDKSQL